MSIETIDGGTINIDLQPTIYIGDTISVVDAGMSLTDALSLTVSGSSSDSSGSGETLQLEPSFESLNMALLDETAPLDGDLTGANLETFVAIEEPAMSTATGEEQIDLGIDGDSLTGGENFYEQPGIGDDQPGYIKVYEPAIYAPEGYTADDWYATEFILDAATDTLTIILHFSTDPLDHGGTLLAPDDYTLYSADTVSIGTGLDEVVPLEQGTRCTVTITRTTTQNSGSTTVGLTGGIIGGSRTSPSTSVTTTTTISVQGTLVNGRCVIQR